MLRAIIKHRDLLSLLVVREIRIRYARAFLGMAWALFIPLVMVIIFSALNFGRLLSAGRDREIGSHLCPGGAGVGFERRAHLRERSMES